jgi:arabinose-5-phosphate isomerase
MRSFSAEDFARFHPGGSLGRRLSKVDDLMRPLMKCRRANQAETLRDVLIQRSIPGRRSGAVMVTDDQLGLTGIFTDSDLARLFENRSDDALDRPIADVMTHKPLTVPPGSMVNDALEIMAERKISELPVIDHSGRPLGMLDITDLVNRDTDVAASRQPAPSAEHFAEAANAAPRPKLPGHSEPKSA